MTSLPGIFRAGRLKPGARQIVLIALGLVLLVGAARSLGWRAGGEAAWRLYNAQAEARGGLIPYRDIYDTAAPGALYLYGLFGALTGASDGLPVRLIDLAWLAGILALTWGWVRRIDPEAAWAAAALFGLCYLSFGQYAASLQPGYLALLPLSAAMLFAAEGSKMRPLLRFALVGLMVGLAAVIQPAAAVAIVPLGVYLWPELRRQGRLIGAALGGVIAPALVLAAVMAATGALGPYLAILTGRAAAGTHITNDLRVVGGADWALYATQSLAALGRQTLWLAPAAAGLLLAFSVARPPEAARRAVVLALGMAVVFALLPALAGQFEPGNWLPMLYFLAVLSGLCLLPVIDPAAGWFLRVFPAALLILVLFLRRDAAWDLVAGDPPAAPADGQVDAMAAYLRGRLQPGDRVQPLDWGGGAAQAMLLAGAQPATRFTSDQVFLRDPGSDSVKALRAGLIDGLTARPPRFVLYVAGYRFTGDGANVATDFPELSALLGSQYRLAFSSDTFRVYEHVNAAHSGLIVYPQNWPPKPDGYLDIPTSGVLGVTDKLAGDPRNLEAALADFVAGKGEVTLELETAEKAGSPIETWLAAHGSKTGELVVGDARVVTFSLATR